MVFEKITQQNHALISITEKNRKIIDDVKFACGVFMELHQVFDTVNHQSLISKLEHYGVRGAPLNLFKSCPENQKRFVSAKYGVLQGSVLGSRLFLKYIVTLLLINLFKNEYHLCYF